MLLDLLINANTYVVGATWASGLLTVILLYIGADIMSILIFSGIFVICVLYLSVWMYDRAYDS
jgi:hypothetical protein